MFKRNPMMNSAYPFSAGDDDTCVPGLTKAEHAAIQIMTSLIATGKYDVANSDGLDDLKYHTRCVLETLEEMFETI